MNRRRFIGTAGTASLLFSDTVSAANSSPGDEIDTSFFGSLREFEERERGDLLIKCTDALCVADKASSETADHIIKDVDQINHHIRRVRFGVRILNERNITSAIDESMVQEVETRSGNATRFIPLVGSFNNLQTAACAVSNESEPEPKDVEQFLYACLTFGLEVGLWYSTAPYQMAWRGTRFASNRTLLRYANHGCNGCIALVMSEIHWALRGIPYTTVSDGRVEFAFNEIQRLQKFAQEEDYEVDLEMDREEIEDILEVPLGGGGAVVAAQSNQGSQLLHDLPLPLVIVGGIVLYLLAKITNK